MKRTSKTYFFWAKIYHFFQILLYYNNSILIMVIFSKCSYNLYINYILMSTNLPQLSFSRKMYFIRFMKYYSGESPKMDIPRSGQTLWNWLNLAFSEKRTSLYNGQKSSPWCVRFSVTPLYMHVDRDGTDVRFSTSAIADVDAEFNIKELSYVLQCCTSTLLDKAYLPPIFYFPEE